MEKVIRAINTNNLKLAKSQYKYVREFILNHVGADDQIGLTQKSLDDFDFFVKKIEEKGMDYWFNEDPMTHWCNLAKFTGMSFTNSNNVKGWEQFLATDVYTQRIKEMVGG